MFWLNKIHTGLGLFKYWPFPATFFFIFVFPKQLTLHVQYHIHLLKKIFVSLKRPKLNEKVAGVGQFKKMIAHWIRLHVPFFRVAGSNPKNNISAFSAYLDEIYTIFLFGMYKKRPGLATYLPGTCQHSGLITRTKSSEFKYWRLVRTNSLIVFPNTVFSWSLWSDIKLCNDTWDGILHDSIFSCELKIHLFSFSSGARKMKHKNVLFAAPFFYFFYSMLLLGFYLL